MVHAPRQDFSGRFLTVNCGLYQRMMPSVIVSRSWFGWLHGFRVLAFKADYYIFKTDLDDLFRQWKESPLSLPEFSQEMEHKFSSKREVRVLRCVAADMVLTV